MISPEHKKLLEQLPKTPYGQALKAYLEDEMGKIDTARGIKSLEEAMGRELALDLVDKLFYFMKESNPQGGKDKTLYT